MEGEHFFKPPWVAESSCRCRFCDIMHNIIHFYSCIKDGESGHFPAVLADAPPSTTAVTLTVADTVGRQRAGCITWGGVETLREY